MPSAVTRSACQVNGLVKAIAVARAAPVPAPARSEGRALAAPMTRQGDSADLRKARP
jgi:hypothetical protein